MATGSTGMHLDLLSLDGGAAASSPAIDDNWRLQIHQGGCRSVRLNELTYDSAPDCDCGKAKLPPAHGHPRDWGCHCDCHGLPKIAGACGATIPRRCEESYPFREHPTNVRSRLLARPLAIPPRVFRTTPPTPFQTSQIHVVEDTA